MKFYTVYKEDRPVRLSEATREFAARSLSGVYGKEASSEHMAFEMSEVPDFDPNASNYEQYGFCLKYVAQNAPIRICDEELVSGAATMGAAIKNVLPVTWHGESMFRSSSHVTLDFQTVVRKGVGYIEAKIDERLTDPSLTQGQLEVLRSFKDCMEAFHIWHRRYLDALEDTRPDIYQTLLHVPFEPARTFRQGVQSIWFTFAFTRLMGEWPGIGRIDEMLGSLLRQDLADGTITIDQAREILASMFIKGCEWIGGEDIFCGSGDGQYYQNLILAGVDAQGNEVVNEVSYLVLDIIEELGIADYPVTVRLNRATPDKFLRRVAQTMRHGGGALAVYNEELVIKAFCDYGYSLQEARSFANDGCWEVQIPGKTYFMYYPFDALQVLLNMTLKLNTDTPAHFDSYEELYAAFRADLEKRLQDIHADIDNSRFKRLEDGSVEWVDTHPSAVTSVFIQGCIEKAATYFSGGPIYNVVSPHIGGAPDTANSLFAIDKLVFKDKKVSFDELMHLLKTDWKDNEQLRQYALNSYTYYGNDNDEADAYMTRLLGDFADIVDTFGGKCPLIHTSGVSTFGRQVEWIPFRSAVPFGRKKGAILSANTSPSPGTDTAGATSIIKSYCKADLRRLACGAALDIKLLPSAIIGEDGINALCSLMRGFVELGGFFMQPDVVDTKILVRAQEHPEEYSTLSVRVSGWNARFVTLSKDWQKYIIDRNGQSV